MIRPVSLAAAVVLFAFHSLQAQNNGVFSPSPMPGDQEYTATTDDSVALQSGFGVKGSGAVPARSAVVPGDTVNQLPGNFDSTRVDFPVSTRPKLLPDNMSFLERGLWGEHGILRGVGIASALTPEVRKHELAVRRTMLTMHQVGGFVTLGLMGTTVYFGQKYLNNGLIADRNMHTTFVLATILSYGTTALLSVLSPPPLIRRDEISTTSIHKTLAWVHFAGMIATPLLGKAISKPGSSYYDRARVHQISAYITTAVFAASLIVVTF